MNIFLHHIDYFPFKKWFVQVGRLTCCIYLFLPLNEMLIMAMYSIIICYIYPSYLCYKDIESTHDSNGAGVFDTSNNKHKQRYKDKDEQLLVLTQRYEKLRLWSVYWIVVALWTVAERVLDATCFWYDSISSCIVKIHLFERQERK